MDMTTAMAKALVDGLETEGVESIWAKLNQKNAPGYIKEPAPEGMLLYVDPENFDKRRRTTRSKKKATSGREQLLLFGEL
jgi:hypothetical protein